MNSDHPTAGDYAMSAASSAQASANSLAALLEDACLRIYRLELTVQSLLDALESDGLIKVEPRD